LGIFSSFLDAPAQERNYITKLAMEAGLPAKGLFMALTANRLTPGKGKLL